MGLIGNFWSYVYDRFLQLLDYLTCSMKMVEYFQVNLLDFGLFAAKSNCRSIFVFLYTDLM